MHACRIEQAARHRQHDRPGKVGIELQHVEERREFPGVGQDGVGNRDMQRHCRARRAEPLAARRSAPSSPGCARTPPIRRRAALAPAGEDRCARRPRRAGWRTPRSRWRRCATTETIGCSAMSNSPAVTALRYAASMAPRSGAGVGASAMARCARAACRRMRHDIVGTCRRRAGEMSSRVAIRSESLAISRRHRAAHLADRRGFLFGPGGHVPQRHVDRAGKQQDVVAQLAGIAHRPESRGCGDQRDDESDGRKQRRGGGCLAKTPTATAMARNTPPRTTATTLRAATARRTIDQVSRLAGPRPSAAFAPHADMAAGGRRRFRMRCGALLSES